MNRHSKMELKSLMESKMNLKRLSGVGFVVAVLTLLILMYRDSILAKGLTAIIVQGLAVLLWIWARITFGRRSFYATADPTEGGLVTHGPYHYFRHPIYASIIYFVWAGILSHLSLLNVLLGFAVTAGLLIRIFAEERLVAEKYPEYQSYAETTKRIIPFIF
jgi:protein-S-isoprenylcysteine O-methyltransferase Ste14